MIVRIRFGRSPRVEKRKGKNSGVAWLSAVLLTIISVCCVTLTVWRLGVDFGWAGDFVFPDTSLLSHWQVWLVLSIGIEFAAFRLNRYGKVPETAAGVGSVVEEQKRMAANG